MVKRRYCQLTVYRGANAIHKGFHIGTHFVSYLNEVLEKLGKHYLGESEFKKNSPDVGDAMAFTTFFIHMERSVAAQRKKGRGQVAKF